MVVVFVVVPVVEAAPLTHLLDYVGDCPLFSLGFIDEGHLLLIIIHQVGPGYSLHTIIHGIIAS